MIVAYSSSSPYKDTPQYSWRIGRYVDRPVPADSTDIKRTLDPKYTCRPDILSNDLYGTPEYYWVFMQRNIDVIRDPIFDMVAGITLYLPTLQRIKSLGY